MNKNLEKNCEPATVPCPHCGAEAQWRSAVGSPASVEVVCPECGRFELSQAEFDCAETEICLPEPE